MRLLFAVKGSRRRGLRALAGLALGLGVAVSAGCAGGDGPAAPQTESDTRPASAPVVAPGAWVVLGSSTAAGAGASAGAGWVDRLREGVAFAGVSVHNLAKGGTVTYEGLSASEPPVPGRPAPDASINVDRALELAPRLILVSWPTNDTALGYSADETVRNLLAIRASASARGVPAILLSTQPRAMPDAQLALLPRIDERLAAELGPCFVAVREALAAPDGTIAPAFDSGDGVHPNDAGHALIHDRVRAAVDSGRCVTLPGAR